MTVIGWIVAFILSAIFVLALLLAKYCSHLAHRMSKYSMTLLLDEITYHNQRDQFLRLLETIDAESPTPLYQTAQFAIEDAAEKNAQAKMISQRMWVINQGKKRSGISSAGQIERPHDNLSSDGDDFPDPNKYLGLGNLTAKIQIGRAKLNRRLRGIFRS